jgi:hypothetical protein
VSFAHPWLAGTRRVHQNLPSAVSARRKRLKLEARDVSEYADVRDERNAKADRRGGDPALGAVRFLGERVSRGFAVGAQPGVDRMSSLPFGLRRPAPAATDRPERSSATA